jgi:hypothetical protein
MLEICPSVTNGLMIGYTTAINAATVDKRLDKVKELTGARIVRRLTPQAVRGKKGGDGFLGAAIYRVDREKS